MALAVLGAVFVPAPASAARFNVTNLSDAGPGSLRAAIASANGNGADSDMIGFAPGLAGRIRLNSQLSIDSAMVITGPGADRLTLSGDSDANGRPSAGDVRIFSVDPNVVGSTDDPVTIDGLALHGGYAASGGGGAIRSQGATLTLGSVEIANSDAVGAGGGGLEAVGGRVLIVSSTFSGNLAGDEGGAIHAEDDGIAIHPSGLTIRETTFAGNQSIGGGGAIVAGADLDELLITGSTFKRNETFTLAPAGGVLLRGPDRGTARITNSTFYDNLGYDGGAVYVDNPADRPTLITNSTLASNRAAHLGPSVYRVGANGPAPGLDDVTISSSIVSGITSPGKADLADPPGATGRFLVGHSLLDDIRGASVTETPPGTNLRDVPAELQELTDNGGPTETMLPYFHSPVIDAGVANGLDGDQRGVTRTIDVPANPQVNGSDGTDIGAAELSDIALENVDFVARKLQKLKRDVKVEVVAGSSEPIKVEARGVIELGRKSFPLRPQSASLFADQVKHLKLKPRKRQASRRILRALRRSRKASAMAEVEADLTNIFGVGTTKSVRIKLKAKR